MTPTKPMKPARIAARADRDIRRLHQHISKTSQAGADSFLKKILAKIHWIAETDFTGVPRDDIAPGLRAFPFRDRCIYYRRYEDRIVILRVLHGAQDTERQSFVE